MCLRSNWNTAVGISENQTSLPTHGCWTFLCIGCPLSKAHAATHHTQNVVWLLLCKFGKYFWKTFNWRRTTSRHFSVLQLCVVRCEADCIWNSHICVWIVGKVCITRTRDVQKQRQVCFVAYFCTRLRIEYRVLCVTDDGQYVMSGRIHESVEVISWWTIVPIWIRWQSTQFCIWIAMWKGEYVGNNTFVHSRVSCRVWKNVKKNNKRHLMLYGALCRTSLVNQTWANTTHWSFKSQVRCS